jgi:hypothetical protein
MNQLIIILTIASLASCEKTKNKKESIVLNSFELIVTDFDYSMGYGLQYVLNNEKLKIVMKSDLEGEKDTTMYSANLKPSQVILTLSELNIDGLKEHYKNQCIDDGSQISVLFEKNQKVKSVHLSNYYHINIAPAIELINDLVPKEYKIWYDRKSLLEDQKKCNEK